MATPSFQSSVVTMEWVKRLDSPTGLVLANGKLYAADVDRIAEIDIAKGEIINRYEAPGSKFLNDLAADKTGRVYASDMVTNSILVLDGGKLSLLMQDDALDKPNGLLVEDGRLVVASWGKMGPGLLDQGTRPHEGGRSRDEESVCHRLGKR